MRALGVVVLATGLAWGCTSSGKPFDVSTMVMPSPETPKDYREAYSLEAIEELTPQLSFPITLAVSQPSSGEGWSAEEIEIIASWESDLIASGLVESLVILPESLSTTCGWRMSYHCGMRAIRRTAARFHADALLHMAAQTKVKEWSNPLSLLNITVVGLWLAPGHHRSATSVIEGVLIDNRNQFLYAFARAVGEDRMTRPLIYADRSKVSRRSRSKALEEFGRQMIEQLGQGVPLSYSDAQTADGALSEGLSGPVAISGEPVGPNSYFLESSTSMR